MRLARNEWGFKVNIKTGVVEMGIPKVKAVTPEQVFSLMYGASKLIAAMYEVLVKMIDQAPETKVKK